MAVHFAHADRTGLINLSMFQDIPNGVIVFAGGDHDALQQKLWGCARLSRSWDGQMFVPGVPEADDEGAALEAFDAWHKFNFPNESWEVHVVLARAV